MLCSSSGSGSRWYSVATAAKRRRRQRQRGGGWWMVVKVSALPAVMGHIRQHADGRACGERSMRETWYTLQERDGLLGARGVGSVRGGRVPVLHAHEQQTLDLLPLGQLLGRNGRLLHQSRMRANNKVRSTSISSGGHHGKHTSPGMHRVLGGGGEALPREGRSGGDGDGERACIGRRGRA
jgi:hypothetical protein